MDGLCLIIKIKENINNYKYQTVGIEFVLHVFSGIKIIYCLLQNEFSTEFEMNDKIRGLR